MPRVLALVDDLMSSSRISAGAAAAGLAFRRVQTAAALIAEVGGDPPALVIVDLGAAGFDALEAVRGVRAGPAGAGIPVIGFGPHVDDDRLQAALAAGCSRALPRSAFFRDLPDLLRGIAGG